MRHWRELPRRLAAVARMLKHAVVYDPAAVPRLPACEVANHLSKTHDVKLEPFNMDFILGQNTISHSFLHSKTVMHFRARCPPLTRAPGNTGTQQALDRLRVLYFMEPVAAPGHAFRRLYGTAFFGPYCEGPPGAWVCASVRNN